MRGESVQLTKDEFFEIYKKIKNNEINIESLDKKIIKRVLQMFIEELKINSNKINEKMSSLKISLDNAKVYNKEIEIAKKHF